MNRLINLVLSLCFVIVLAVPAKCQGVSEVFLVQGAPGEPTYSVGFGESADRWTRIAEGSTAKVTRIGDAPANKEPANDVPDRELLKRAIEASETTTIAPLWIVLIGHGTYASGVAKFNLRGPDLSASDLSKWLDRFERPLVIINGSSSSGPFINALSGRNRIVVTATKSGTEQNYARFGEYFSKAIGSIESDLDHDQEVSVQEAFLRASAEVRAFYESEDRIVTEHALVDDNGDGLGTPATMFRGVRSVQKAKDDVELDGRNASRVTLVANKNRLRLTIEEQTQRDAIERDLDQIRIRKSQLSEAAYLDEIEPLMVRLAKIYQAAESRQEAGE
ncbi:hypothetical protein CA13_68820 [Planctomycetes bacterium CA13]|uniref:Uncharacterized protein n=1 Tax=Novipirellula herctigrandis TaxID=2527986 RepID=A0A5C5YNQ5_9BACT|nr:hypothetical protein CA13_68820 [Planctomycetes bacterium CA13]